MTISQEIRNNKLITVERINRDQYRRDVKDSSWHSVKSIMHQPGYIEGMLKRFQSYEWAGGNNEN